MILRPCRLRNSSRERWAISASSWARSRADWISFSTARWRALISASRAPSPSSGLQLVLERLEAAVDVEVALLLDVGDLLGHLVLEAGQVLVPLLLVDPGDQVRREVDDLLELLGLELLAGLGAHEQVGQPRPGAAQVPDVHDGRGQLNVAHAVAADLGPGDLDAAALADDALEAHPLVLAAVALPVLGRAEDLLAEEPVLLGAQRAVVDRLGLLDLAVGPTPDGVARGQSDAQLVEGVDVQSH